MASVVSIDDDELTCSICLEIFIDPRILPCAFKVAHLIHLKRLHVLCANTDHLYRQVG